MISAQNFKKLGFTDKETAVYLALLELDSATPAQIAKKADINRTSCYDVLENLTNKGLIGKIKKKKKIFFISGDPKRLISYFEREREEKDKEIVNKQQMVSEMLPELASLIKPKSAKPKVTFFEGEKGVREAYEDTLNSKETILAYANVQTMHEGLPKFFPEYYKRRAKANIHIKAIMPQNKLSQERALHNKEEIRESAFFPDPKMTFSPEVNIYNDKMLIASWPEKMAVLIESKELADLQKLIFNLLWNYLNAKKQ